MMRDQLRSTVKVVAPAIHIAARIRQIARRDQHQQITVCVGCRYARVAHPLFAGTVGFCRDCIEAGRLAQPDLGGEA
jgi:hypothetical protein